MRSRTRSLLVALALAGGAGCPLNSESDCQEVCSWWKVYCTGESLDSCLSDCRGATDSAKETITRCVDGAGWGTPSSCQSASCCVKFVYEDYYYQLHCL